MKKNIICFSFIIFLFVNSKAQNWNWAFNYNNYWADAGKSLGIDTNNNNYVLGSNKLYKFNSAGSLIWKDSLLYSVTNSATNSNGNTFLVGGNMVYKYDSIGNQVWNITISADMLRAVAIYPTGGVVVTGYLSPSTNYNSVIHRIDENGNVLWTRTGDFMSDNQANNSVTCDMKGYSYVVGQTTVNTGSIGNLIKIDSLGNLIYNVPTPYFPDKIAIGSDLSVCILGQYCTGSMANFPFIIKYDSQGNQLWNKMLSGPNISKSDIAIDSYDNIFISGTFLQIMSAGSITLTSNGYAMYILKLDFQGNFMWGKNTNSPANQGNATPYSMKFNSKNDLIITGSMTNKVYFDSIILNQLSMYSDIFLCNLSQNIPVIIPDKLFGISVKSFPNPTNNFYTINFNGQNYTKAKMRLFNNIGQEIYSELIEFDQKNSVSFNLSYCSKGIYFIELIIGDKKEVKKIVLE